MMNTVTPNRHRTSDIVVVSQRINTPPKCIQTNTVAQMAHCQNENSGSSHISGRTSVLICGACLGSSTCLPNINEHLPTHQMLQDLAIGTNPHVKTWLLASTPDEVGESITFCNDASDHWQQRRHWNCSIWLLDL